MPTEKDLEEEFLKQQCAIQTKHGKRVRFCITALAYIVLLLIAILLMASMEDDTDSLTFMMMLGSISH